MTPDDTPIRHVSDTALWVAYYRALETERPDALFRDPYARRLVGERGAQISAAMGKTARYTSWTVVIRTVVIDEMIARAVADGADTVLNLGAGMDARPYRLAGLPADLRWIEVDHPESVARKERLLAGEAPRVRLERVGLDLADRPKRRELLARLDGAKVLVLTEGLIPYLSEEEVSALAEDLSARPGIRLWIAESISPKIYPYLRSPERVRRMKNAPFRFFPDDWLGFFARRGWEPREVRSLAEASLRLRRAIPMPWWARIVLRLTPRKTRERAAANVAFVLYAR
jgi:methyltransferase (TIGR00027 family)